MRYFVAAVVLFGMLSGREARADGIDQFTLTIGSYMGVPGDVVVTFQIPSSFPGPTLPGDVPWTSTLVTANVGECRVDPIGYCVLDPNGVDNVYFYPEGADGGGIEIAWLIYYFGFDGPQLFTSSDTATTFRLGTFQLFGYYGGPGATLTVSEVGSAETPEPSGLWLLGSGALVTGGVLRRRLRGRLMRAA